MSPEHNNAASSGPHDVHGLVLDDNTAFAAGVLVEHCLLAQQIFASFTRSDDPLAAADELVALATATRDAPLPDVAAPFRNSMILFHAARQGVAETLLSLATNHAAERAQLAKLFLPTCIEIVHDASAQLSVPVPMGFDNQVDELVQLDVVQLDDQLVLFFHREPLPARTH